VIAQLVRRLSRDAASSLATHDVETCAHTDPLGNRCQREPTHHVTWPKHALWSADYCEVHVNEVRRVPGVTVTLLDGEEE
jgi:hypothetical protein